MTEQTIPDNATSAIFLWKHDDGDAVRFVATESTAELMSSKSTELVSPDNVEELIEQDDWVYNVDVFVYLDKATAEAAKQTILMSYRNRGIHEEHDEWPDAEVGQMTGGEGLLVVHSYDSIAREEKIQLQDLRGAAGYDAKADERVTRGSWQISKTELARADGPLAQTCAQRSRADAYADIAASDPSNQMTRLLQDKLAERPGAYVSFVDVLSDSFEDELVTPQNSEEARRLQGALIDAAEHISGDSAGPDDNLSEVREAVKQRTIGFLREHYPEFVAESPAPTM